MCGVVGMQFFPWSFDKHCKGPEVGCYEYLLGVVMRILLYL